MPRKPKLRRRTSGWSEEQIQVLVTGTDFFDVLPAELRAQAWKDERADIMREWLAKHPDSRPWGWWAFEAKGRRERVDGGIHPFDDPTFDADRELLFGVPRWQRLKDRTAIYETEAQYLKRVSK